MTLADTSEPKSCSTCRFSEVLDKAATWNYAMLACIVNENVVSPGWWCAAYEREIDDEPR